MEYELIDSGNGRRLERFGDYVLDRPDPEVLWQKSLPESEWFKADAVFEKGWLNKNKVPERWVIEHNGIKLSCKLTPFKHTGVFPEQVEQWDYIFNRIKVNDREVKVLNLFAYTGAATMFAAKAGAYVTHVDASKPAVTWANENAKLNGITNIRWIVDDVQKFIEREVKRGSKYDVIMMDPPVYGHGPSGTVWDFNKDFPLLLDNCKNILSDIPLFILVNSYATSSSSITLANTLQGYFGKLGGTVQNGELTLKESSDGRLLSTGIWAKLSF